MFSLIFGARDLWQKPFWEVKATGLEFFATVDVEQQFHTDCFFKDFPGRARTSDLLLFVYFLSKTASKTT